MGLESGGIECVGKRPGLLVSSCWWRRCWRRAAARAIPVRRARPNTTGARRGHSSPAVPPSNLSGSPLNVLTLASVNYAGPTYANILTTAKVAGDWINAHGGIQGHPVKVTTCDEQGDPTKTAQCGREAIANHDVAVVGSFTLNGSAIIPELAAANISWFGICCAASADELTSPDVQQIGSTGAAAPAMAVKAIVDGCKHIAAGAAQRRRGRHPHRDAGQERPEVGERHRRPGQDRPGPGYRPGLLGRGGPGHHRHGLHRGRFGSGQLPVVHAAFRATGAHQRLYGPQGNLDITVTKPFPSATENAVIAGAYSDISLPAWANYRAALQQYHAPTNENYNSLGGLGTWAAYMAFEQMADSIKGPINNQTFLAAAQKATINLPGVPVANFGDKFTALGGNFLNDVSRDITFDVVHNGVPVAWDGGKFFDMTNAYLGSPLSAANTPPPGQNG